ncbi:MAG TPA: fasciclin domain-containing protein, partial [Bacteroidales bacterium]
MKNIFIIGLLVLLFASCKDKWDDHYSLNSMGNDSIVSNLNLLDYLRTQPQYSKFVDALEKTGVAQELSRDQYLTVWAVDNDAMSQLESIGMVDTFVMQYHVNYLKFTYDKLKDGMRLKALNNKYIPVKLDNSGIITMANVEIKKPNQICKNGVVNELSQLMVPLISIYDYVRSLGGDYSMIRDSILSLNDTLFDKANSVPVGVDKYGNTVYDSAFYIKNPIMDTVDIRSEFIQSTMFLPSNAIILNCIGDMKSQYEKIGRVFAKSDTTLAF